MRDNTIIAGLLFGAILLGSNAGSQAGLIGYQNSSDFDWKYEMNVSPELDNQDPGINPEWAKSGSGSSVSGGVLTYNTMPSPTMGDLAFLSRIPGNGGIWPGKYTLASGFTIETRIQVLQSTGAAGFGLFVGPGGTDRNAYLNVGTGSQGWSSGNNLGTNVNSDDFHVFRITQEPSSTPNPTYRVWRDGILLSSSLGSAYTANQDGIWFGDGAGGWAGEVAIDYVRFTEGAYAPEIGSHPNLYAWYKADAGVEDADGNLPDNMTEHVQVWKNQAPSGSGRDLTLTSSGTRWPKYDQSATLYGKPAVHFDTNDDIYRDSSGWGVLAQPDTIFMVLRTETANGGTPLYGVSSAGLQLLISGSESGYEGKWVLGTDSSPVGDVNESFLPSADIVTDQFQIHTLVFDGANTEHYIDGQLVASGAVTSKSLAGLLLGAFQTGLYGNWTGDIAEMLIYDDILSAPDRESIEGYLYQKYFVPEPSAVGLLLLGVAIVWLRRRK